MSCITFITVFIWSIFDAIDGIVFDFDSAFLVLLAWWSIGAFAAVIAYFVTAIKISPVIKNTDALLVLEKNKCEDFEN